VSVMPGIAPLLAEVRGNFYREVDRDRANTALAGSHRPARYSRADQPTLYLSSSPSGVDAAMQAHRHGERPRIVLTFGLGAASVFDLREAEALAMVRREAGDPLGDWQRALAHSETPSSWRARDWIEASGAVGLIDPSRRAAGLWHLVLFRWNEAGAPTIHALNALPD